MGYSPWDHKRVKHDLATKNNTHTHTHTHTHIYIYTHTHIYKTNKIWSISLSLPISTLTMLSPMKLSPKLSYFGVTYLLLSSISPAVFPLPTPIHSLLCLTWIFYVFSILAREKLPLISSSKYCSITDLLNSKSLNVISDTRI